MLEESILTVIHKLFPTTIYKDHRETSIEEKDMWENIILENLNEQGRTQDWLGFSHIHHYEEAKPIFEWIVRGIRRYLMHFNIYSGDIDINVTKSFINLTRDSQTPEHEHSENHITFTYYPHVAQGREQNLRIYNESFTHPNEPYTHLFAQLHDGNYNLLNSLSESIIINEGDLIVMPSKLRHSTEHVDGRKAVVGTESFDKDNLFDSRICIAGDCVLTKRAGADGLWRLLNPVEEWRKFD
jgi:hypothetical protein